MKIVITGGAGFIGSHLAEQFLIQNNAVVIIDNFVNGQLQNIPQGFEKLDVVNADISQTGNWYKYFKNVDQVYHLAALADIVPSIKDPSSYYQSNVTGTFNVLEASRQYKVQKFIYAASASCYGLSEIIPTPETAQIDPQYPYAMSKRLGEELVLHWDKIYDLNTLSLRLFNVYPSRWKITLKN